jgi:hypothetical protein
LVQNPIAPLRRYDTAGAGDLEIERLRLPLKRISIKNYIVKLDYPIAITITKNLGVIKVSFLAPAVSLTPLVLKSAISKSNIFANSKPYAKML